MMDAKDTRRRSPSFPSISLPRAIQLVSRVYGAVFDSPLDTNTVLELMGFSGISGASRTALSSLKQFGLLEGRDTENKVTKLAAQILHPVEEIEKLSAVVESSRKPNIYNEIFGQFKGSLPEDKIIKAFLIRNHGFSDAGSDSLIKNLRETEDFVSPIRARYRELISSPEPIVASDSAEHLVRNVPFEKRRDDLVLDSGEMMRMRLGPSCEATVSFAGTVDQKAISKLIAFLELAKDGYPE